MPTYGTAHLRYGVDCYPVDPAYPWASPNSNLYDYETQIKLFNHWAKSVFKEVRQPADLIYIGDGNYLMAAPFAGHSVSPGNQAKIADLYISQVEASRFTDFCKQYGIGENETPSWWLACSED